MLQYKRIDTSEGIGLDKTDKSKKYELKLFQQRF